MTGLRGDAASGPGPLRLSLVACMILAGGCGGRPPTAQPSLAAPALQPDPPATNPEPRPVLSAREAYARGWMPLSATRVTQFLSAHPTYDGRGVLIAILDSGIDPGIPGLALTSTGERKILDLRDFSGEGSVPLGKATVTGDEMIVAGHKLSGVSRLRTVAVGGEIWTGALPELALGELPQADLNGDGDDRDTLAVAVVRASDGWVLFADSDGDGSLANEKPVHDYLQGRESFGWHTGGRAAPLNLAVNLREERGSPKLDLFFDTSAHGSHVAGIAAARDMYAVKGFNGVAPGAMLLGLKIANNALGEISTTGSMLAAMDYAIRFAATRRLPLVVNISFGVGNEREGTARIDGLIDSTLAAHPDVVSVISAGNDGPGLSTVGFPASADRAITVGATLPGVFLGSRGAGDDPVAYFSSRGGELAKPDIVAPGMAYSTVPRWNTGDEQKSGTSMASPYAAGLVALLLSGRVQQGHRIDARQIRQALMVTARPVAGETYLDDGTGQPDVTAAWRWLQADPTVPDVQVRAESGATAAFRVGPLTPGDSLQRFGVTLPEGAPTEFTLRSSAAWLLSADTERLRTGANTITLRYRIADLARPGVYVGVVGGWAKDTARGPLFRLVNTVVVPEPDPNVVHQLGDLPAGGQGRVFFQATRDRPFAVAFGTLQPGEQVLAYLHEPGGQPYRDENGIGAGYGEQAGLFVVDGRDVVPGTYQAVAVAPPLEGARATIVVQQSPVRIQASRDRDSVLIELTNVTDRLVNSEPFVVLVGAERSVRVNGRGSAGQRVRLALPDWAVLATVDVSLERDAWSRFTDFGVTMLDSEGRVLGKSPLNYAFGRQHVSLVPVAGARRPRTAEVLFSPGLAEPRLDEAWTALLSVKLYADSAHVTRLAGKSVAVPPRGQANTRLPLIPSSLTLDEGFVPLGIVVVPEGERTWTRETPLTPAATP